MCNKVSLSFISGKCDCCHIEKAFHIPEHSAFFTAEESLCRSGCPSLLGGVDIVLRCPLYAFSAGLYLYKMYSIRIERNYVDFKVGTPPVPFQYSVSF